MKRTFLFLAIAIAFASCDSTKGVSNTVSQYSGSAATLLNTLSPDSKLADIANLFTLLDADNNKAISTSEAIGIVSDNFGILDKNNSLGIDLKELGGLLDLLK